ncbi:MAG: IS1595 family transposase [Gammaproteobacteria bacterium]|nr:IS1595 family transposase [Gammaproteobacteria bacterium]
MKQLTVREFFQKFPDDETCLQHIFDCRYGQGHECPKCGRETKWYRIKAERAYSCQYCGHHLHPTVGTPFESSRTSLQSWFYAIYLFTTTRHGVSAKEIQRQLGVTYKTAWRMGHEIREHMADVDNLDLDKLDGHVEIDETILGGKVEGQGRGRHENKTVVLGMLERNGDVVTKVVPDTKKATLIPEIRENVDEWAKVSTDSHASYRGLKKEGYNHESVDHTSYEWVRGDVHTNSIEAYWSNLKRSLASTHIHISKKHTPKYLEEFEYRFNSRENPEGMFSELISTYPEKKSQ